MPISAFKDLPAPWTTRGPRAWWILTSLGLPSFSTPPKLSDAYFYDPETGNKDVFQGGPGMVQVLRYDETPAGPYDELLIIPGRFKNPEEVAKAAKESSSLRISRIYVSNLETTYAGRRNWNIPKSLARFEFKDIAPGQTQVRVYPRNINNNNTAFDFSPQPFFAATLTTASWSPTIPFNASKLPMSVLLAQPPIPSSSQPQVDAEVETEGWVLLEPKFSGPVKLSRVEGDLEDGKELSDGVHFPKMQPYTLGIEFQRFEGYFTKEVRVGAERAKV